MSLGDLKVEKKKQMLDNKNKSTSVQHSFRKNQKGFNLLEVLVSVMLISFALVSLTSLHTSSVKHSTVAYVETQAALYLQEAVELLRANRLAASDGGFDLTDTSFSSLSQGSSMAETDRYRWFQNLNSALPGVIVSIDCNTTFECLLEMEYDFLGAQKNTTLAVIL